MQNNNVTLHRVISAPPEKVFRAFSEPTAYASWIPPYGFICEVEQFEFKNGGQFKMAFVNFTTNKKQSFGGMLQEIRQDEFLSYTDRFDDPGLPGEITTSVWFKKVTVGTELTVVQENIPEMIPADMCYLGWQDSLDKLRKLVEPHIPDS